MDPAGQARLKSAGQRTDRSPVPNLMAMVASSAVAWLLDTAIRGVAGAGLSMLLTTIAGGVTFFYAKRFFSELRDGA